jgi:hypothetical protein
VYNVPPSSLRSMRNPASLLEVSIQVRSILLVLAGVATRVVGALAIVDGGLGLWPGQAGMITAIRRRNRWRPTVLTLKYPQFLANDNRKCLRINAFAGDLGKK